MHLEILEDAKSRGEISAVLAQSDPLKSIAAFLSTLGMLRGTISSRLLLFIVGVSIVIGAFFSLLASSESISQKKRDELVRKSDDQTDITR